MFINNFFKIVYKYEKHLSQKYYKTTKTIWDHIKILVLWDTLWQLQVLEADPGMLTVQIGGLKLFNQEGAVKKNNQTKPEAQGK